MENGHVSSSPEPTSKKSARKSRDSRNISTDVLDSSANFEETTSNNQNHVNGDVQTQDESTSTNGTDEKKHPILKLIANGDTEGVRSMITQVSFNLHTTVSNYQIKEPELIHFKTNNNATLVHYAVHNAKSKVAAVLIELGADINQLDKKLNTPLHLAAMNDYHHCAKVLLKNGAEFKLNKKGESPLHVAIEKSSDKVLSVILEHLSESTANLQNKKGQTALHIAAASKDGKVLSTLLSATGIKWNVNAADEFGRTPLHIACSKANDAAVQQLIEYGATVNVRDKDDNTPLHYAAVAGSDAMVSLLVRKGAEVVVYNKYKKTPMHLATEKDKDDVCYILTANGADVSIRYQWKGTITKKKYLKDEEIAEIVSHANAYGFVEEEPQSKKSQTKISRKEAQRREEKRIEIERRRSAKWASMIKNWDNWVRKKNQKIKSRVKKGLPESIRGEAWKRLAQIEITKGKMTDIKYQDLLVQKSSAVEQIDLDINRSYRNHIQFKERFGFGQVTLFNVLKAYSVYDTELGYCQGMSDMTAFLLMYLAEEDAFWTLVTLLHNSKYNMRGLFLNGFPLLHRSFWIFEQLMQKLCPKLERHFKEQNVATTFYATKWFMTIFLDAFPFSITVRLWDLFLYKGYDIVYTIAIGVMKMFEKKFLSLPFDQIMGFFRTFESLDIEPDEFIEFIMRYKQDSADIRKLEHQFETVSKDKSSRKKTQ